MSTLAAFSKMLERGRKREGLRVCRAAWLFGVTVREYRELEAGDQMPTLETYGESLPTLAGRGDPATRRHRVEVVVLSRDERLSL